VKKALLSLAVAGLALSAVQASFGAVSLNVFNTSNFNSLIPVINTPSSGGFWPLQEAYRIQGAANTANTNATQAGGFETGTNLTNATTTNLKARNVGFCGVGYESGPHYPLVDPFDTSSGTGQGCLVAQLPPGAMNSNELVTAVPGIFALCSNFRNAFSTNGPNGGLISTDIRQRLNVNAFAFCPPGFSTPFVQSVRLVKTIPYQPKCPGVFPGGGAPNTQQTITQFGGNIRTWWALLYSTPGTRFTLAVTVACQGIPASGNAGQVKVAIDNFNFAVVVTVESLLAVVDVLHSNPISTSEIPCIAAEDAYLALRIAVARIGCATPKTSSQQDRLFEAEALVVALCAFGDCFIAEDFFPSFAAGTAPSNDQETGAFGMTGILDTIENPCCCKLLVDLDNLGNALGITTAGP